MVDDYDEEEEDWNWERIQARAAERLTTAAQRFGLSQETIDKICACHFDRILEKHEGPESWESTLRYYDVGMFQVGRYQVLFPFDRKHHRNVTTLRCIVSQDEQILTIFFRDTTYVEDPEDEPFWAGFMAVCEKFPTENFYLTTVYHEWFIVDNQAIFGTGIRGEIQ